MHARSLRRPLLASILVPLAALACGGQPPPAPLEPVIDRARLGHNIEDIEHIPGGPLQGHIAILDGYDVYSMRPGAAARPQKRFDLRALPLHAGPRGLAYLAPDGAFAVVEPSQPGLLFLCDRHGNPLPARPIHYPDGFTPDHVEALATIPAAAPIHPGHLILVAERFTETGLEARFEIIRPSDGVVVAEILPPPPIGESFISGLTVRASGELLVSMADNNLWTLDLDGEVLAGPTPIAGTADIEGIAALPNGRVAVADLQAGELAFLDEDLAPLPALQRSYDVGVGVNWTLGLAWDPDGGRFLVDHFVAAQYAHRISAVPPSLDAAAPLADLPPDFSFLFRRSLTYLPDEHLAAAALPDGTVLLFDAVGAQVDTIDLTSLGGVEALEYIPPTGELVVKTAVPGEEQLLHVVTREGVPVRQIDLSATGIAWIDALAYFDAGQGGGLLVLDHPFVGDGAFVTDLDGALISSFSYREELGVIRPFELAAITTGPNAGAFALVDDYASEIVVFQLL